MRRNAWTQAYSFTLHDSAVSLCQKIRTPLFDLPEILAVAPRAHNITSKDVMAAIAAVSLVERIWRVALQSQMNARLMV